MSNMPVIKTLVIGLGSTGTEICNHLVERLNWEYGGLDQVPWVRFLTIETDNNKKTPLRERGDFLPLGLDSTAYSQIMNSPEAQGRIRLQDWADMETLRKLKNTEGGAGNIRMVGRLTFMYSQNFNRVKLAVLDRITALRDLKADQATNARGKRPDGSNPAVTFEAGGEVRVFVVGTLCGGTGSGLLPDFGYFLRSVPLSQQEKIIGIFTLPHDGLAPSISPASEKLKRNAYHALIELNHYHQARADELPPIHYSDGTEADLTQEPYDLPFLVMPSSPTETAEQQLNGLVADRIFMNIVNPTTDPFNKSVNAPMPDRDHQAHVFCSFGLSTIEFPAQQVAEACASKLHERALADWQSPKSGRAENLTGKLGLDYDTLVDSLLERSRQEWEDETLKAPLRELDTPKLDAARLDRVIGELRQTVALHGALTEQMRGRRDAIADEAYDRFVAHVRQTLLDRTRGPQVLTQEVEFLTSHLKQLQAAAEDSANSAQTAMAEAWQTVEQASGQLRAELKKKSFLNPNRASIEGAQQALRRVLRDFTRVHIEASVYYAIRTHHTYGTEDLGVAERVGRLLDRVHINLRALDGRVTAVRNRLQSIYSDRASTLPPVNGLALFEPRVTVQQEYDHGLKASSKNAVANLGNIQADLIVEILESWKDLPAAIAPPKDQIEATWVTGTFDPRGKQPIPQAAYDRMHELALRPFVSALMGNNVVERLRQSMNANSGAGYDQKVKSAAERSRPFLVLDRAGATLGNRSPVPESQFLLLPPETLQADKAMIQNLVSGIFAQSNTKLLDSPDSSRAMFLQEAYRFPLRGLPQVLGRGGLWSAECNDFPTFHTRRDVDWYGLSGEEGKRLEKAEEAIILGVLLGELTLKNGLVMPWEPGGFGDNNYRRLPPNLKRASRVLAKGEKDMDNSSLSGALATLRSRIESHWKHGKGNEVENSEAFVAALQDRLAAFYRQNPNPDRTIIRGWLDQQWAGRHLQKFTASYPELLAATNSKFRPPRSRIDDLTLRKDERGRWGGTVTADGLYCPDCGGQIGTDEDDAARNGWTCFINPAHYHGSA